MAAAAALRRRRQAEPDFSPGPAQMRSGRIERRIHRGSSPVFWHDPVLVFAPVSERAGGIPFGSGWAGAMAQYDLTPVLSKHLDRHLVFPLLEFLGSRQLYDAHDIEAAKLQLIEKTNMVDYAVDIYQQLNQTDEVRGGTIGRVHHQRRQQRQRWAPSGLQWQQGKCCRFLSYVE